jgi:hypothetical protein
MLILVVSVSSVASALDQSLLDLHFKERAANVYNPSLKKVLLDISKDNKLTTTQHNSIYVPMKDVFKQSGATFNWDGKKKITTVKNQVVLPREWVQLKNGVSSIDAFVLAYIFEVSADDSDQVRVDWKEKLNFLDIKGTAGLPGLDKYMHVNVQFND